VRTALSTGLTYFGGGTAIQRACGFEDTPADMIAAVTLAAGPQVEAERIRLYCEGSVQHFEWFRALGVEYKPSFVEDKLTHPITDDCLMFSGNELSWPDCEQARPFPRGHKPARTGEAGGYLMEAILRGTLEAGARVVNDCRAQRLVQRDDGRVVGVLAVREGEPVRVGARRGVVLATGGFIFNNAMVAKHAPHLLQCNYPTGTPGDDGSGILMGTGAGGEAINMGEGLVLNAYYPPSGASQGRDGGRARPALRERGRLHQPTSDAISRARGARLLVVDDALRRPRPAQARRGRGELRGAEKALAMPEGVLVQTLEHYNRFAQRGEDPLFHKAPKWLRPLQTPPYAALDCSTQRSLFGVFTLGGLAVSVSGEVLSAEGEVVPGLYAAGRCTAGLIREGRNYASGLSIGDASFFGRLAGLRAAHAAPWR
jgi:succinate dehydrogenase/fumarate reductase flavoprotein subunit